MTALMTNQARAYVNHGRWIADCPRDCGSALILQNGQGGYHCPECGHLTTVEWPADVEGITAALMERPIPKTRNWFPEGHTLALRAGCEHGQTVQQLRDETHDNMGE
jgi:hypothetical protein